MSSSDPYMVIVPNLGDSPTYGAPWKWTFDPLRAPDTDEEPWSPPSPAGVEDAAGWWLIATALTAAALVAVLVARRLLR